MVACVGVYVVVPLSVLSVGSVCIWSLACLCGCVLCVWLRVVLFVFAVGCMLVYVRVCVWWCDCVVGCVRDCVSM